MDWLGVCDYGHSPCANPEIPDDHDTLAAHAYSMSSPGSKTEKMDVDRLRSPDRRSKSYVVHLCRVVLGWTFSAAPATNPLRLTALVVPTVRVLATANETRIGKGGTATVVISMTDTVVGTGESGLTATETMTATGSGTGTENGTRTEGGTVMVSAVAVNETETKIDVGLETVRGTGNATATAMTVTTGTGAGSALTKATTFPTVILRMRGSRGSEATTPMTSPRLLAIL